MGRNGAVAMYLKRHGQESRGVFHFPLRHLLPLLLMLIDIYIYIYFNQGISITLATLNRL